MRFDIEGDFDVADGRLTVRARHDHHDYLVAIEREVFERHFGATATGDFHEYWSALLQHRSALESAAESKVGAGDDRTVIVRPDDLKGLA